TRSWSSPARGLRVVPSGWSGSMSTRRLPNLVGMRSSRSMTRSPLGSMTMVPRRAWMWSRIVVGSRVGLTLSEDPRRWGGWRGVGMLQGHVVAADLGLAQRLGAGSTGGHGDRGGHWFGSGPVQARYGEVVRQGGDAGQFGGVEQEAPPKHPGVQDRCGV